MKETDNTQKREYTGPEIVFAWMSFLFGYMFCKAFPAHLNPLGAFLLVLFAFSSVTVVLKVKRVKPGTVPVIAALSAVVVSATLILNSNYMMQSLSNTYAMVTFCYFIYAANGNAIKRGFNDFIIIDYFRSLFVAPFLKVGKILQGMFTGINKKSGAVLYNLLKGGCIALIPTLLVCALLSYDQDFSRTIETIGSFLDFDAGKIIGNIWAIGLGIIVGQYVFSLFLASADRAVREMTEEECMSKMKGIQKAHVVTTIAAVLPVLLVYLVFFISQWKYYVSAFSGRLPSGISYADYAREGFFQLCIVSFINMIIIVLVQLFMDMEKQMAVKVKGAVVIIYAACTLILIATAMSKMLLYINSYGLTRKRLYSSWFMIALAILFVVAVIKQFYKKLNAVAVSFALAVIMFAALALPNADGLIAKYNVDMYLEGSLKTVDVRALEEMGDAAVPEMVRLLEELEERERVSDEKLIAEIRWRLMDVAQEYRNFDRQLMSCTLPYHRAEKALKRAGITHP